LCDKRLPHRLIEVNHNLATTVDHRIRVATLSQKSVIAHAFAKQSTLSRDPAIDGKCLASDTTRYLMGGNHEIIFGGFSRNLLSRSI
jgi:hypothetical protein